MYYLVFIFLIMWLPLVMQQQFSMYDYAVWEHEANNK